MIPDLDIYRSAQVLVKQHGADAPNDYALWGQVVKFTEGSLSNKSPAGEF